MQQEQSVNSQIDFFKKNQSEPLTKCTNLVATIAYYLTEP
jgi:hypothetical protein